MEPADATQRIFEEYSDGLDDDAATFWLALAATQSKMGRLQEEVKQKALEIIDWGADIQHWRECGASGADIRKRNKALLKLRGELTNPQRKPTKVRKVYHDRTDWEVGYAIAYRLLSGRYVILRVIGIDEDRGERLAIVGLCDFVGDMIPPPSDIEEMPRRQTKFYWKALQEARDKGTRKPNSFTLESDHKFTVYANSARQFPKDRVRVVATGLRVKGRQTDAAGASYFGGWKRLDEYLQISYDLQ